MIIISPCQTCTETEGLSLAGSELQSAICPYLLLVPFPNEGQKCLCDHVCAHYICKKDIAQILGFPVTGMQHKAVQSVHLCCQYDGYCRIVMCIS